VTLNLDFKVMGLSIIIDAIDVLCAQLMHDLFVIAKFLFTKLQRLIHYIGHSDIVGNKEADKLAKQAAAAEYVGPEPALGFSTIAVRSKVLRQWAHNEHNKHWLNTEGCRQAKEQVTPGLTQFAL